MEDSLIAAELATFGVSSVEETLPMPPKDTSIVGTSGSNGVKRSIEATSIVAPIGRAKRPKNVKFSPAKPGGKALARRSMSSGSGLKTSADGEVSLPNNDFCDACGGKGHFLCCDGGCLRSFHFTCLEPPMELDDLTDESWFCKTCRAIESPPPKYNIPFFKELIYRVDTENPKAFLLTPEIKGFFKNVTTGSTGEFIDIQEHRPPSKITGRAVGQEDRDGYRLKDKSGRTILCYKCNTAASLPKLKRIISCDFCEQHWHLDCLDPPMTGMPPPTRKWMCPVHSDHVLPKTRQLKQTQTIVVQQPGQYNNGDVIIVPRREAPRMDEFEEVTVNRIRYQVPEETLIVDFWGRLQDPAHLEQAKRSRRRSRRDGSPISMDSPSSSDGISDADPPHLPKSAIPIPPPNTVALDNLAALAELFFTQLKTEPVVANDSTTTYSAQDKGKGRASAERSNSPANNRSNSMKRNNGNGNGRIGGVVEFSVQSKDDLKALMHVRKLLSSNGTDGTSNLDQPTRSAYFGFLDGEAIVPKLAFIDDDLVPTTWGLPWDDNETPAVVAPVVSTSPKPTSAPMIIDSPSSSSLYSTSSTTNGNSEIKISAPKFTPRPSYVASTIIDSSNTNSFSLASPKIPGLNSSISNPNRPTVPLPKSKISSIENNINNIASSSISTTSTPASSTSSSIVSSTLPLPHSSTSNELSPPTITNKLPSTTHLSPTISAMNNSPIPGLNHIPGLSRP